MGALIEQNPATAQDMGAKSRTDAPAAVPPGNTAPRISLDVQVTDNKGVPIRGLQQQDFSVLDEKQNQNIVSFAAVNSETASSAEPPVEIVLVVDAVNTSPATLGYVRDEVKKFLLSNDGQLAQPVSLVVFSRDGAALPQASRDGKALAASYDQQYKTDLKALNNQDRGFQGDSERFNLSLQYFSSLLQYEQARPGRKLVVWVGPGWPTLGGIVDFPSRAHQDFFNSAVAFSTQLREARMTLYSIQPEGANEPDVQVGFYTDYLKGVTAPSKTLPANLGVQVLAIQSGGRVFLKENNVAKAIAECVQDARSFYVLAFDVPRAGRANDYHKLAVTVDRPKTIARTRTGYYAQP
jgi:VWFA-related protein